MNKRGFASDNNSGVHPDVLNSLQMVNSGHVSGYGTDRYTEKAIELFKQQFGEDIDVYFVFNGTGANTLSINTLTHSFHSVICPSTAHIMVDECGAPEKISGCKLIPIETNDGKLSPELIRPHLHGFDFEHHAQPKIISISQVSELGTLYTVDEIKAITKLAHQHNMYVHMDGARIANAAVALDLPFSAFTRDAGIDVLSFGGTKNGLLMGEAVVFFNPALSQNAKYFRKQSAQLFSKMRFVSAQFIAYFENELWKKNATHANRMAALLAEKVSALGVKITQKTEANGIFAIIDDDIRDELQKHYFFYPWNENTHEVRWMTSFDTTEEDINNFCHTLGQLLK
ncbi:threonine aldolase family protein [Roseimarinus sediminis]|jgi:threonine aldolase|uniref:threonine aldolase family protein n=1 Tax=Roseimarinus sediminis TaxID=1610899 RepID=UPI003D1AFBB8